MKDNRQTELVAVGAHLLRVSPELLRGHVGRRSVDSARLVWFVHVESQPEIGQQRFGPRRDQDVGRLDVTVQDPFTVGVRQCLRHVSYPGDRLPRSDPFLGKHR